MLLKKGKITKNQNKKELREFCKGLKVYKSFAIDMGDGNVLFCIANDINKLNN